MIGGGGVPRERRRRTGLGRKSVRLLLQEILGSGVGSCFCSYRHIGLRISFRYRLDVGGSWWLRF
jgi:hypothetical protein